MKIKLILLCAVLSITACKVKEFRYERPPNILLIIADDLGKDATNGFTEGTIKPHTPHIDSIRVNGLSFTNFWTYSSCSPTRASMICGKYGYRTGVTWVHQVLSPKETILQKFIKDSGSVDYATAVIGKWHLAGKNNPTFNPETLGLDYYAGFIGGGVDNYNSWPFTEDGATTYRKTYITQTFTNLAVKWVKEQQKPWFLWWAHVAPHTPFHAPPAEMHSQGPLETYKKDMAPQPYHMAMIESLDYEIGRFLDSIPEDTRNNTVIIFLGDNGTAGQVAQFPYTVDKSKKTLYQGGINCPLFVCGPGVLRKGVDDNLITSTDIFATIAEIAGVKVKSIHDSHSFKHLLHKKGHHRDFQYSEMNDGKVNAWVISNGKYKLFTHADGHEEFYSLLEDPYEYNDLIGQELTKEQLEAKAKLIEELKRIRN